MIIGDARAVDLTYSTAGGGEQATVRAPWHALEVMDGGRSAYVSAQIVQGPGGVACQIVIDGVEGEISSVNGFAHIATCAARVPRD